MGNQKHGFRGVLDIASSLEDTYTYIRCLRWIMGAWEYLSHIVTPRLGQRTAYLWCVNIRAFLNALACCGTNDCDLIVRPTVNSFST